MKNFVLAILLSFGATSAMADDCSKLTSLVGDNWNTITDLINICKDNNSYQSKQKAWRLAEQTFDLLIRTGNACVRSCGNYPDNRQFCQESNSEVPGFRSEMYSLCN